MKKAAPAAKSGAKDTAGKKASSKGTKARGAGRGSKETAVAEVGVEQVSSAPAATEEAAAPVAVPTNEPMAGPEMVAEAQTEVVETRTIEPAEDGELVPLSEVHKPKSNSKSRPAARKPKAEAAPRSLSCLDAAVQVLKDKGEPMRCKDLIDAMAAQGLWKSNAPTPAATLSSAILREVTTKGDKSRFRKSDRGLFTLTSVSASH